jgi:hypothetical protein
MYSRKSDHRDVLFYDRQTGVLVDDVRRAVGLVNIRKIKKAIL